MMLFNARRDYITPGINISSQLLLSSLLLVSFDFFWQYIIRHEVSTISVYSAVSLCAVSKRRVRPFFSALPFRIYICT